MSFIDTRFPVDISFGATGGPVWFTDIVRTGGGYEYSNQNAEYPLCHFDVSHAARTQTKYATLLAFQRAMRGRFHTFRFKDWSDYSVATGQGIFASLTSTTFQMYRTYVAGSATHNRIIQKPVSATVTVTGGTTPVVDYTTGIVTVASGTPTSWIGEIDVPCRFDQDDMQGQILDGVTANRILGWTGIGISEVRL